MLSRLVRNRLAFILAGMVLLHLVFFWGQWRYIRAGLPDFTILYTAGKIVAQGQAANLYNNDVQRAVEKEFSITVGRGGVILPYNHPPYEAALFVPFAAVRYWVGYLIWLGINISLAIAFILLLRRQLDQLGVLPRWFYVLLVLAFPPMFIALMQGQDVVWVVFCYALAYTALRRDSEYVAGGCLALGLCKFHLVVPFLFAFLVQRRAKVLAGFLVVAILLVLAGFAVVGVRASLAYPGFVWKTDHTAAYRWATDHRFNPNIRALILTSVGESRWASALVVIVSLALMVGAALAWKRWARASTMGWRLGFGLNVFTTVLVSYHTWVQDMSLLLLPILVSLDVLVMQQPNTKVTRGLLWWTAGVLFCSPLYLLLILKIDQFYLITFAILAFVAGIVALARSQVRTEPLLAEQAMQ